VSSRHNTRYLTGGYFYPLYEWDSHTRRTQHLSFLGLVGSDLEKSFFVGRPGEADTMEDADVWVKPCIESPQIGIDSTVRTVAEELRRRGLDSGCIAIELTSLPASALVGLQKELPHAVFVEASGVLDGLRAVKLPRELDIVREGAIRKTEAVEAALKGGKAGESTASVADRVHAECQNRGLHHLYSLVCPGPSFFRPPSRKQFWNEGRPLHIDAGSLQDGYVVEICRMGHMGAPSKLATELIQACIDLRDNVLPVFMPGTPAKEVQAHANSYLASSEFGEMGKFIAHGIGMVHHEDPIVNLNSDQILEHGMFLSIELEYRHKEVGHIKVEELIVVTDDGCELIAPRGEQCTIAEA